MSQIDPPQNERNAVSGETTPISARDSVTGDVVRQVGDTANKALRVNVVAGGGGGGGTQYADGTVFAPGGSIGTLGLAVVDDGSVAIPATGDMTPLRLNPTTHGLIVGPVIPGSASANLGKTTGNAVSGGDVGVAALWQDSSNNYVVPSLDGVGALPVTPSTTSNDPYVGGTTKGVAGFAVVDDGTVAVPAVGELTPTRLDPTAGSLIVGGVDAANATRAPIPLNDGATAVLVDANIVNSGLSVNVDTIVPVNLAESHRSDNYVAAGTGTVVNLSGAKYFGIQVVGAGAAATSWTVHLRVSVVGSTADSDILITHTTADGDGKIKWCLLPSPVLSFYSECSAVVLGGATGIGVNIIGTY